MKYCPFVLAILLFACKKESADSGGDRLAAVTVAGKTSESYIYNGAGLLIKENRFAGCEQTPADEFSYAYNGTKLTAINTVLRSLYSSTSAICDPASGLRSEASVGYDSQNRLSKIIQSNGTVRVFQYNAQGFIEEQTISQSGNEFVIAYGRDAAGNLIAQTDSQGNTTRYEFDNKRNPYFIIKQQPNIITAFNNSPNNVVKVISGSNVLPIRYDYNSRGLPVKMYDNGSAYEFVYE